MRNTINRLPAAARRRAGLRRCLLVVIVSTIAPALAQEYRPFPQARITPAQWQSYLNAVVDAHGDSGREFPAEHLVVYQDDKPSLFWAFTTAGHPAHPAWITRRVIEEAGEAKVEQVGYFAGDEAAFAQLFQQYLGLTERTVKEVQPKEDTAPAAREPSFAEAQQWVKDSRRKPGYARYLAAFARHSNQRKLDERGGCHLLSGGAVTLIIALDKTGVVESAVTDVNHEKAQCFKRMYRGTDMEQAPPHAPFAIELVIK